MDTLPDLTSLSDTELSALLKEIEDGETAISERRHALHKRIDRLRAERTRRLKEKVDSGSFEATTPTTLERPLFEGTGDLPAEAEPEPVPDLSALDDTALWTAIRLLEKEEDDISLGRRVKHAQIDIIRAERTKRARSEGHVEFDDLDKILGGGQ